MSHLPAARAADRPDRQALVFIAVGSIFFGLALSGGFPRRQLPTPAHRLIGAIGMCSLLITLFRA